MAVVLKILFPKKNKVITVLRPSSIFHFDQVLKVVLAYFVLGSHIEPTSTTREKPVKRIMFVSMLHAGYKTPLPYHHFNVTCFKECGTGTVFEIWNETYPPKSHNFLQFFLYTNNVHFRLSKINT